MKPSAQTDDALQDGEVTARLAGLRYVNADEAGLSRRRRGKGFSYHASDGALLRCEIERARIERLAIPPAYEDVWICADADGHLQAIGRDERGRRQYRYHNLWRSWRDRAKFASLVPFAETLPRLRRRVRRDLKREANGRDKVAAAVVYLLDHTLIRVGNERYAKTNRHYGLTTLQERHVDVEGALLSFHFVGKGGKAWSARTKQRRVAKILRDLQDLPGQRLFQYQDAAGAVHPITSLEVNAYLQEVSGRAITAKDFRTWAASVMVLNDLFGVWDARVTVRRRIVNAALEDAAGVLGNTKSVCRKSYVHPLIVERFEAGALRATRAEDYPQVDELRQDESATLAWLRAG